MLKPVKSLVLITISALFFQSTKAQLKLPVTSGVANDVKKVIDDYPNRFNNLMGEVIVENTQSIDYRCNFNINGAEEAFITRYSAKKEICSWQALMLTTDNFEKAKQKFKSLFNQLNNLVVQPEKSSYKLKGKYEAPEEEKKFTSILFTLDPTTPTWKKLKVELSMEYEAPMDWKVKVLVYDRERDDDERGQTKEGE
jgi:hypothetical protein